MTLFVHLTPASQVSRIRKNGILRSRRFSAARRGGVFAMPVVREFYVSHQWLRELRRRRKETVVAVYFRIPDGEEVWVGRYQQSHRAMTASRAIGTFMSAENREGWEVVISRRIEPREIHRFKRVPQVVGWRFYPEAKGKRPCSCPYCSRGDWGSKKLRARLLHE